MTNEKKVTELLNSVQSKSKLRTLSYSELVGAAESVYSHFGIPKKYVDCEVYYVSNAQIFPNAYKYTPESTCVIFFFKRGKVYIKEIRRGLCNYSHSFDVYSMSKEMIKEIVDRMGCF